MYVHTYLSGVALRSDQEKSHCCCDVSCFSKVNFRKELFSSSLMMTRRWFSSLTSKKKNVIYISTIGVVGVLSVLLNVFSSTSDIYNFAKRGSRGISLRRHLSMCIAYHLVREKENLWLKR